MDESSQKLQQSLAGSIFRLQDPVSSPIIPEMNALREWEDRPNKNRSRLRRCVAPFQWHPSECFNDGIRGWKFPHRLLTLPNQTSHLTLPNLRLKDRKTTRRSWKKWHVRRRRWFRSSSHLTGMRFHKVACLGTL